MELQNVLHKQLIMAPTGLFVDLENLYAPLLCMALYKIRAIFPGCPGVLHNILLLTEVFGLNNG